MIAIRDKAEIIERLGADPLLRLTHYLHER